MTILYNCRHAGETFRITKFSEHMEVESSYLCTESTCDCPAGVRPTCRHREMLPKFIQREHVGDEWFFDFDRGGWVQLGSEWAEQGISQGEEREPVNYIYAEEDCPGHVASEHDPKVCGRCGVHIDSLRPDDEPIPELPAPTKPKALFIRRRV